MVELIGAYHAGSRSRLLADATVQALNIAGTITVGDRHVLELADIGAVTFTGTPAVSRHPIADPYRIVRAARLLVVATPTANGTYTGLLKTFLDQLRPGDLAGTVAVPVAVTTGPHTAAAIAASLTGLLTDMGATLPGTPLVLQGPDDPQPASARWAARHGAELADALTHARGTDRHRHAVTPPRSARLRQGHHANHHGHPSSLQLAD